MCPPLGPQDCHRTACCHYSCRPLLSAVAIPLSLGPPPPTLSLPATVHSLPLTFSCSQAAPPPGLWGVLPALSGWCSRPWAALSPVSSLLEPSLLSVMLGAEDERQCPGLVPAGHLLPCDIGQILRLGSHSAWGVWTTCVYGSDGHLASSEMSAVMTPVYPSAQPCLSRNRFREYLSDSVN